MRVELKRSTPIEFSFLNSRGETISFTAPACTVGGYREALRLETETEPKGGGLDATMRLVNQAVALCGEPCRPFIEAMDVEMVQEVIQAQVALHSGVDPAQTLEVMRAVKKKALTQAGRADSFTPSTN